MPDIALEPRPGDSVGPYRITRVIGRGRMGIVFEAVDDGGDPVAVKVVTTELTQDEVFLRRFRREVEAAQRIQHQNVVPVLAHGEEGGLEEAAMRTVVERSREMLKVQRKVELNEIFDLSMAKEAEAELKKTKWEP